MSKDHELMIGGIKLKFPNKPYPSQISMMDKIIKGLKFGQNCLLESPTGSGKTLSLLCSSIGWQIAERESIIKAINEDASIRAQKLGEACYCDCRAKKLKDESEATPSKYFANENQIDDTATATTSSTTNESDNTNKCPCMCHGMYSDNMLDDLVRQNEIQKVKKVPTIFFCSRTHKQLTNVINEFRKTSYAKNIRMTILSSRQHTCIHGQVSKMLNKNEGCKKLNKKKSADPENENEKNEGCTFYYRLRKNQLLLENIGFKQNTYDIEEAVTAFKKKRLCPYYGLRELMECVDIVFCPYNYLISPKIRNSMKINLKDQIVIIDEAHNTEDACRESTNAYITKFSLESSVTELGKFMEWNSGLKESCEYFIGVFQRLISWIDVLTDNMDQSKNDFDGQGMSKIYNGLEMVAELKSQIGIGPDKYPEFQKHINQLLSTESENESESVEIPEIIMVLLGDLNLILEFLYMENHHYMDDFKIAITKKKFDEITVQSEDDGPPQTYSKPGTQQSQLPKWTYTINFWCMNPGVAFYYLKDCHSVILCSGTLSPMDTFQSELGVKFEHQLEANHVIKDKQVWVGCLGSGPTNVNLTATYKNQEMLSFQDELGRLVLDVCKSIPFGVLFFVPSYGLMQKLENRWKFTKLEDELKKYKRIFAESKSAKNFDALLGDYYRCIDESNGDDVRNGALLFGVYRGRASEGLDFSNNYGRAVIAVGIPYPNVKDTQVDLKRNYNRANCKIKNLLSGDEWFEIQAYRAVNQALGRVIRHRNDWGAIILVDERYFKQPEKYTKGLSKWLRTKFVKRPSYQATITSLTEFGVSMKEFKGDYMVPPIQPDLEPEPEPELKRTHIKVEVENYSVFSSNQKPKSKPNEKKTNKNPVNTEVLSSLSKFQRKNPEKISFSSPSHQSDSTEQSKIESTVSMDISPINQSTSKKRQREDTNALKEKNLYNNKPKRSFQQLLSDDEDVICVDEQDKSNKNSSNELDFMNDENACEKNEKTVNSSIEEISATTNLSINTQMKRFNFSKKSKKLTYNCHKCDNEISDYNQNTDILITESFIKELPYEVKSFFNSLKIEQISLVTDPIDQDSFEANTSINKTNKNENFKIYNCKKCSCLIGFSKFSQDKNIYKNSIVLFNA